MFNRIVTVCAVAALSLAAASLVPNGVAAKGIGSHHGHGLGAKFSKGAFGHNRRAFGYFPYAQYGYGYGGGVVATYSSDDVVGSVPLPLLPDPVIPPPPPLTCKHSLQTLTVPSEEGGTREIAIRRC
jgi:hypothetical protein